MPAWLDQLGVAVVVGGAALFVLLRVRRRVSAVLAARRGRGGAGGAGCGCDCPAAPHGGDVTPLAGRRSQ
ncbi:MAG: hypothetical protein HY084_09960 [Gemmatimonadetes bacterium]|nr:hypothetical protein [Gemmatimonadota bacterium]